MSDDGPIENWRVPVWAPDLANERARADGTLAFSEIQRLERELDQTRQELRAAREECERLRVENAGLTAALEWSERDAERYFEQRADVLVENTHLRAALEPSDAEAIARDIADHNGGVWAVEVSDVEFVIEAQRRRAGLGGAVTSHVPTTRPMTREDRERIAPSPRIEDDEEGDHG